MDPLLANFVAAYVITTAVFNHFYPFNGKRDRLRRIGASKVRDEEIKLNKEINTAVIALWILLAITITISVWLVLRHIVIFNYDAKFDTPIVWISPFFLAWVLTWISWPHIAFSRVGHGEGENPKGASKSDYAMRIGFTVFGLSFLLFIGVTICVYIFFIPLAIASPSAGIIVSFVTFFLSILAYGVLAVFIYTSWDSLIAKLGPSKIIRTRINKGFEKAGNILKF